MDFLKILKSVEEFVYEALTWLILLPRTLLRIVLRPLHMADYARTQLRSSDDTRFSDAVSPPLLLILCVLLSHFIDLAIRAHPATSDGSLASALLASEQNLLVYRTIAFGVWALVGATWYLVGTGQPVNRESLRAPFYEQCYLVSPFALLLSLSVTLGSLVQESLQIVGALLCLLGTLWFWLVEAAWLRRNMSSARWRSLVAAVAILVAGATTNAAVGRLLQHAPPDQSNPPAVPTGAAAASLPASAG